MTLNSPELKKKDLKRAKGIASLKTGLINLK